MPTIEFSTYADEQVATDEQHLVVEAAPTHFVCMAVKDRKVVTAFEQFAYANDESRDFNELYKIMAEQSRVLNNKFASAEVFINDENCIAIPAARFDEDVAGSYLYMAAGDKYDSELKYEHIQIMPGIVTVFRVRKDYIHALAQRHAGITYRHTHSNILKRFLTGRAESHKQFISLQFYKSAFIATVVVDGDLQLIRTFEYDTAEDVLYFVFDIMQRFSLSHDQLTLQLSGMITHDQKLHKEIMQYFKKVIADDEQSAKLNGAAKEYPLHYFIPFVNLIS